MDTNKYLTRNSYYKLLFLFLLSLLSTTTIWSQDSTATGFNIGRMDLPDPISIQDLYEYDPIIDRYIYSRVLGTFNISYPVILTPEEYQELILKEEMRNYFKEKISAVDGKTEEGEEAQKNLLPTFYVNSGFFETVFGGDTIEVIPQGSVEMDLGLLFTRQDNPAFSPRNRRNLSFDFQQRISLSLLGNVGERLQINANYDTQSTFDFQNQIKLDYTPTEDDIIQSIEVGNVNMPLNSTLIQGAQSLFGVKTQLQFGKTTITGVFSEQQSETRSVTAEGGATVTEFEFFAADYDENRHFFLAHYFRDNYERVLRQYPFVNSNVQITRAEVWVTNRTNRTDDVRTIVAIQDIGESDIENIGLDNPPGGFLNRPANSFPDNRNNDFNPFGIDGGEQSILNNTIRDIATVDSGFGVSVEDGTDYSVLENSRRLQPNEYQLNSQLGYISLNQRLNNDEVLGVAFQYTVNGQVFQVGEFSTDGVDANGGDLPTDPNNPDPDPDPDADPNELPVGAIQQNLVVKMLKSSITFVEEPIWDLMMKNIYSLGTQQLEREDFQLNILYTNPSPINYITQAEPQMGFANDPLPDDVDNTVLLRVFNLDRLNFNNDPQEGGDGFFDFSPGITVDQQNGRIIFTSVEPFGEFLFNKLDVTPGNAEQYDAPATYNVNQNQYVYRSLYTTTKIQAEQEDSDKNLFQIRGRFKSTGSDGIAIGAFNIPQGSVTVTAGGRTLVEGVDYTVNYQLGRVQILDPALQQSNTPINITVENNTLFGQQTRRFTGLNIEHQFNEDFLIGATYLNLNERPLTQKANFNTEPINNTIFGLNANYSTEVPFLTRLVNKLPNIDTDVESNLAVRGEFAYLIPGAPRVSDFNGRTTAYVDDFEASQTGIDIGSPLTWFLSSAPIGFGGEAENSTLEDNFRRALLNWYTIDPVFYSPQRPDGITEDDLSNPFTRRVFRDEIFPNQDIIQGQTQALFTLDLAYYPSERGPYNYNPEALADGDPNTLTNDPTQNFGGISRQLTTTDFERSNVEYIQFWVLDPFVYEENAGNPGGFLTFNLGNISEDVLKDGRKLYENGLPEEAGSTAGTLPTPYGKVPINQALIYTFDSTGDERTAQDIGYDGLNDAEEQAQFPAFGPDPANDNYEFFLQRDGSIPNRYRFFNGVEGNSPEAVGDTNRGSTAQPDLEDINRDNTMNTVNSYFEYNIPIRPGELSPETNRYVTDVKLAEGLVLPNNETLDARWVQFRVPISDADRAVNGISDFRSIRFMRMFMHGFTDNTTLRLAEMELVRGDYRRFNQSLDLVNLGQDPTEDDTTFENEAVSIEENAFREPIPYVLPPGVIREQLNNNNNIIRQNERSLALRVNRLDPGDARGVFKNFNIDMRQYENLEMFIHAEDLVDQPNSFQEGDMVAFIRLGNDLTQNYYEVQLPLTKTNPGTIDPEQIWPIENRLDLQLSLLQEIKTRVLGNNSSLPDPNEDGAIFFSESELGGSAGPSNELNIGIKGNPSFGNVRTIMLGVRNLATNQIGGEVWFNEMRLSELKNEAGWAAVAALDANIADFANITATGNMSTIGFGGVEQAPNQRSREDAITYDVVTNINAGQLLPKKWGVQLPFNYGISEEFVTPQFDPEFQDIELETRLDNTESAEEREEIREQSISYTRRQSINLIGVRKERTGEAKPRVYDVENLTFAYSYNQVDHRDFQIEESLEQNVRAGVTYNHNFQPKTFEPFKKKDSLFNGKYWQFLKDVNLNYLPTNITAGSNIVRRYNEQRFREINLEEGFIPAPTLFQRNYLFDWDYAINWNLTKSLRFNFSANQNRVVSNFIDDAGVVDNNVDVWDGFFEIGDPNIHNQSLQLNYDLPFSKFPFLKFIRATYSYTGDFQWQDGSDLFNSIDIELRDGTVQTFDLGNTIQNSSAHRINSNLDMNSLYKYFGLTKKRARTRRAGVIGRGGNDNARGGGKDKEGDDDKNKQNPSGSLSGGDKTKNFLIGLATSVKKIQVNYTENRGTFLPGYTPSIGFAGTIEPTTAFTFGGQRDLRELAARKGWLTLYPEFNEQYSEIQTNQLDIQANLEPIEDIIIDFNASRSFSQNYVENFIVEDGLYQSLTPNTFGNFNISTLLLGTAFSKSDEFTSEAFDAFRDNRLIVANRLAAAFFGTSEFETDEEGFPVGFGKTSQDVLLPAFLAAYKGSDAATESTGIFRNIPLPNWDIKYTGLMKLPWFKKRFKRFSLQHGYRAGYTVNQFQTNLDFDRNNPEETDQAGNIKSELFLTNVNLTEQFSPLIRIDFELKNSVKILGEIRRDRALGLSFANNLLTEIQGNEIIVGLGYRIKDLRIATNFGGRKSIIKSDLNFRLDMSRRDNKTIIRFLDLANNQTTAGQTIYGLQFGADYALTKNLTALFYYDHTFAEYAISTAFPQTTIRSGFTLRYNFGN